MVHDWDWKGAEASFRRALAGAPGSAGVLRRAGVLAANLGRLDEAIGLDRRAVEQDPLSASAYTNLGMHLHATGRFAEAELPCRKAIELAPQRATAHAYLALNLLAQGRVEEARVEALHEPEEWARLWASAIIDHSAGRQAESDAALQKQIAKYQAEVACQVAQAYAARGETDLAFEWLERAYAQRDPGVSEVRTELLFRTLHTDPRWDVFLRKLGLAD
jgi:thioredoxin-like negative regulator of GroEL